VHNPISAEAERDLTKRLLRFRSLPDKEDPVSLAEDLLKIGRYGDARGVAVSAQRGKTEDVQLFLLEARAWYLERDLARAQAALLEAARTDPKCAQVYTWFGEVMLKRGDPERAVRALQRALSLDPNDVRANDLCGRALRFAEIARSHVDQVEPAVSEPRGSEKATPTTTAPEAAQAPAPPAFRGSGKESLTADETPFVANPQVWPFARSHAPRKRAVEPPEKPPGPTAPVLSLISSDAPPSSDKPDQSDIPFGSTAVNAESPNDPRSTLADETVPVETTNRGRKRAVTVIILWTVAVVIGLLLLVGIYVVSQRFTIDGNSKRVTSALSAGKPASLPAERVADRAVTSQTTEALRQADPNIPAPRAELALLDRIEQLAMAGKVEEAQAQFSSAPEVVRDSVFGQGAFARLALARGKPQEALNALSTFARSESLPPTVSVIYADALLATGRVSEAAVSYHAALSSEPDLPEALFKRAQLAVRGEQTALALEFIERAERSPKTQARPAAFRALLLTLKGRAYIQRGQKGDFSEASGFLSEAIAIDGAPAEAHFWLGEALAPSRPLAATTAYQRYLEREPDGVYAARARRALLPRP
jgi:tetratricopeptide (TPR) repeat protein